jgi:hypothetical protein
MSYFNDAREMKILTVTILRSERSSETRGHKLHVAGIRIVLYLNNLFVLSL